MNAGITSITLNHSGNVYHNLQWKGENVSLFWMINQRYSSWIPHPNSKQELRTDYYYYSLAVAHCSHRRNILFPFYLLLHPFPHLPIVVSWFSWVHTANQWTTQLPSYGSNPAWVQPVLDQYNGSIWVRCGPVPTFAEPTNKATFHAPSQSNRAFLYLFQES